MDEFLSELYIDCFKKWVLFQTSSKYNLYLDPKDSNTILIETDKCSSRVTFNRFKIIELCVINKQNERLEFYIHFQMQNLKHAKKLFEEMQACIYNLINKPTIKVLLSCSGGLTTGYFAEKLNQTAELLELDYQFQAIGFEKLLVTKQDFDVLLLAPQISYQCAKIQEIFNDKLVLKIPTRVFAKYDCLKLVEFIKESLSNKNSAVKSLPQYINKNIKDFILCLSVYKNNNRNFIDYRLYGKNLVVIHEKQIIKENITILDIYEVLNTVLLNFNQIDYVAISLPGVIYDGYVYSSFVEGVTGINFKQILELKYNKHIILENDVNSMAVGYYVSQTKYKSLSFLFQPQGLSAGLGIIINGQLVKGCNSLAGEVKFLPLPLSASSRRELSFTPKGTQKLLSLIVQAIMCIIASPVIVIYNDFLVDLDALKHDVIEQFGKDLQHLDFEIIKVDSLPEYILLGLLALSSEN